MSSSRNKSILKNLLLLVVFLNLLSAVAIFILALTGDTTLLGDPYYEDQILAPQRALIPWLITLVHLPLAGILGWIVRKKS